MALSEQQFNQLVSSLQKKKQLAANPEKALSGDAAKLYAITQTAPGEIDQIKEAFRQNYKKSLLGITTGTDRKLSKLVDNVADKVGRIRSGGAINKEEEARFKRQIVSFKDIPFGKEEDAIAALDGYLNEIRTAGNALRPSPTSNLSPELQQYVNQRKQELGLATPDTSVAPIQAAQPPDERTGFEKVLGGVTAIPRFLTGHAGEKIGEALGTGIAKLRATPQEKQFIEAGPTGKELAKDVGNVALNLVGSGVLGKLGIAGKAASKSGAAKLAQSLEEANLRLTPVQRQNIGNRLKNITDYTSKLSGNPGQRLQQARSAVEADEGLFQRFINTEAKNKTISKKQFLDDLNSIKSKYANDRDILDIERQVDNAIKVAQRFPSKIPVNTLNQFKRTTFKNAFSRAGDKVSDAIEYEVGDVAKNHLEQALKGLKIEGKDLATFNKEYGNKIAAEKLLKIANSRKEIGLVGKLIGSLAGGTIGGAIGGPGGAATGAILGPSIGGVVAGTRARTLLGQGLRKIAQSPQELGKTPLGELGNKTLRLSDEINNPSINYKKALKGDFDKLNFWKKGDAFTRSVDSKDVFNPTQKIIYKGKVVGRMDITDKGGIHLPKKGDITAYLDSIRIIPEFRKKGIAKEVLIQYAKNNGIKQFSGEAISKEGKKLLESVNNILKKK